MDGKITLKIFYKFARQSFTHTMGLGQSFDDSGNIQSDHEKYINFTCRKM